MIVLHGGPGAPGYMAPVARALADEYRVLEPLQRPSGGEPLTVARHVADLDEVVRAVDGKAALVGSSWGAMLALAWAAAHPDAGAPLCLVGSGTFDLQARARMKQLIDERKRSGHHPHNVDAEEEVDGDELDERARRETWDDMVRLQNEGVYPQAFAAIRAPVLMLHGDYDPHPGDMIRDGLKPHLPQLEYQELPRCGHYPWRERGARDEFFARLRRWLATVLALACCFAVAVARADDLTARAEKLVRGSMVVDTHQDVPWELRDKWADLAVPGATKHVDVPRLRKGGFGAVFFALYTPGEMADKGVSAHVAFELSDLVDRVVAAHPRDFVAATTVAEIRRAHAAGRIAILKGIEGGHAIENSLGLLRVFHRLGVRYMTLTHTNTNDWADSLGSFKSVPYDPNKTRKHGGLTDFGRQVVAEMNRLGIAVDVSHVSPDTLRDVLAVSRAPAFASHSSCRALVDNPRNLGDDQIRALAAKGGVVMINASSAFLDGESLAAARADKERPTTLARYADCIEHALKLAPGGVGLGTDFDGMDDPPSDFADVSYVPKLVEELLRRGHSADEIRGVLGENFLRYLSRVEKVAAQSSSSSR